MTIKIKKEFRIKLSYLTHPTQKISLKTPEILSLWAKETGMWPVDNNVEGLRLVFTSDGVGVGVVSGVEAGFH